jgi:hypothetical protein
MWEAVSFAAGMVVLMLLYAILGHVFELPEIVMRFLRGNSQQPEAVKAPDDPDEQAARILGEGLARARIAPKAVSQIMEAFWAANGHDRRALAHVVGGMTAKGRIKGETLLAVVRSLPTTSGSRPALEQEPLADANGQLGQIMATDRPHD